MKNNTKTFIDLIKECLNSVEEIFPWDLSDALEQGKQAVIVDVREPYEFDAMHIKGSINVPRGILETACEYDYEETVPELVEARDKEVILVCRSGNRSVLAAYVMQQMGYQDVKSLKTGLRGWNDDEQPLVDNNDIPVEFENADVYFAPKVSKNQQKPK